MLATSHLYRRLSYEQDTGALIWVVRPLTEFADERQGKAWNAKYAGKRAGTVSVHGYRIVTIDHSRKYRAARIIWQMMTGSPPRYEVDHKNGDRVDDRWDNLRLATSSQQKMNRRRIGKAGPKGVWFDAARGKYQAKCGRTHLGRFDTEGEAHAAYVKAAHAAYGEFARAA